MTAKLTQDLADDLLVVSEIFDVPLRRMAADLAVSTTTMWKWLAAARARRRARVAEMACLIDAEDVALMAGCEPALALTARARAAAIAEQAAIAELEVR